MTKQFHPLFDKGTNGNSRPKNAIYKIIPESIALGLRPTDLGEVLSEKCFKEIWPGEKYYETGLSVSVIVVAPRYKAEEKRLDALLIQERNPYDTSKIVNKFPSGAMNREDIDIIASVIREFRNETGYEARDIQFCFAIESSSTVEKERHIKVYFLAKNHEKVGEPTEKSIENVFWHPYLEIGSKMPIPKQQVAALKPITDKIMGMSPEIMFLLMNNGNHTAPMEGELD